MKKLFFFVGLFSFFLIAVAAKKWQPMTGELGIDYFGIPDPDPNAPLVSYIVIKGKAAERIYKKMIHINPIKSLCENGAETKIIGDLECVRKGKKYQCEIGINLETGKSTFGRPC
jgi:hypothetical protein